jgi:cellulose synthase/poly-beta-1,6-N-acetylglucosamine synthase-like glycosyltransferase
MLNNVVWFLTASMLLLAVLQTVYVVWYYQVLARSKEDSQPPKPSFEPSVAVILCLRGPDPALPHCLEGLLAQDYPNFKLHLVVDDADDPVLPLAEQALEKIAPQFPVKWHTVTDRSKSRSLKCSALMTAVMALPSDTDVVALVDADAIVQNDWLTKLVAPLANEQIGATTGNRWFEPLDNEIGSRLRAIWNAAALPQMTIYQIAWGGALAIKTNVIQQCNLLDLWSTAFCEDTLLTDALRHQGLRVYRVPDLILVNQESTSLKSATGWIGRQLLTVRLYHRAWPAILLHSLFGGICFFAPLVLILVAPIEGFALAGWCAIIWPLQLALNVALLKTIEVTNRRTIRWNPPLVANQNDLLTKIVTTVILQFLYPFLALGAATRLLIKWRGIAYRVYRGRRIEMVEYKPFSAIPPPTKGHSIE